MHESQQTFADSRCWTCASLKWVWGDGEVSQIWSVRFPTVMEHNKDISIAAELSFWRRHKAPVVGRSSLCNPTASSAPARPNTVFSLSVSVRLTDKFSRAPFIWSAECFPRFYPCSVTQGKLAKLDQPGRQGKYLQKHKNSNNLPRQNSFTAEMESEGLHVPHLNADPNCGLPWYMWNVVWK